MKPLIATSPFYEIKKDISTAHKNRSFFKKVFLQSDAKVLNNPAIYQYARAYEMKFHQKYEDHMESTNNRQRHAQYIKRYQ